MKNPLMYLVGSVLFILLAVVLVSVIQKSTPASKTDIRARAAAKDSLELSATVASIDAPRGIITVSGVHFTDKSRSGQAADLGAWDITAPAGYNSSSIFPGQTITFTVDAESFQVKQHAAAALSITADR